MSPEPRCEIVHIQLNILDFMYIIYKNILSFFLYENINLELCIIDIMWTHLPCFFHKIHHINHILETLNFPILLRFKIFSMPKEDL